MKLLAPCLAAFVGGCGGQTSIPSVGSVVDEAGVGTILDGSIDAVVEKGSAEPVCMHAVQETRRIHTDIFILLDASGSMNCPISDDVCDDARIVPTAGTTRWTVAKGAIDALLSAPSSVGREFGLGLLTNASEPASCDPATLVTPRIDIGPPTGAGPIIDAIATFSPRGTTPMTPALQGAIAYAQAYATTTPNRIAVVLLVTDGVPNGCDSTLASTAMTAGAGFLGAPLVKTFLLGVGNAPGLDDVALRGSGGFTRALAPSPDLPMQIDQLLQTIEASTSCDFVLRSMTDRSLDYDSTVVLATIDDAAPVSIGRVDNAAACTEAGGWYYDVNPPGAPTMVILCPQSCSPLKSADTSKVDVTLACDGSR
jgi:hypothetical protein